MPRTQTTRGGPSARHFERTGKQRSRTKETGRSRLKFGLSGGQRRRWWRSPSRHDAPSDQRLSRVVLAARPMSLAAPGPCTAVQRARRSPPVRCFRGFVAADGGDSGDLERLTTRSRPAVTASGVEPGGLRLQAEVKVGCSVRQRGPWHAAPSASAGVWPMAALVRAARRSRDTYPQLEAHPPARQGGLSGRAPPAISRRQRRRLALRPLRAASWVVWIQHRLVELRQRVHFSILTIFPLSVMRVRKISMYYPYI